MKDSVYTARKARSKRMANVLTVLAIIIAVPVLLAVLVLVGGTVSRRAVRAEARALFAASKQGVADVVREEENVPLPEPVQRWLRHANVVGRDRIRTVRLKQKGFFRQSPHQPWMPFVAEQYYTTDPPAFLWHATIKATGGLPMVDVKDSLGDGHGKIQVKLGSLVTLTTVTGPELDQGALLRFLNETMWFPAAAVYPYIQWSPLDAHSARATISHRGITASAVFDFDEAWNVANMTADRYRTIGRTFSLDPWSTPITGCGEFHGVRVPTRGEGVWHLPAGDFSYIQLEITDVGYNLTDPY